MLSLWRAADTGAVPGFELETHLIAARFRWARQQGHPAYVWPDLPIHAWRSCLIEIERAVGRVLGGARTAHLETPDLANSRGLGIAAFTAGVGPLLGYWVRNGRLTVDDPTARVLDAHYQHSRARAERLRFELDRLLGLLGGTPVTIIKGGYTARTYFAEPALRPTADLDVVIEPADRSATMATLAAAGYQATVRQARPFKCDWVPPGAPVVLRSIELTHADNPYAIEVHDSLERAFDGIRMVRLGSVREQSTPWPEAGTNARRLRQPALTALLALHASEELHQLQLVRLVELILVIQRDFRDRASWADLTVLLEAARACRFVFPAFELCERLVPGTVDADFRNRIGRYAHTRLQRAVERMSPATAQRVDRLSLEERLLWADGFAQTVRRLAYLAWPVRARHSGRPLSTVYRERFYRVLRGRLGWHDR